MGEGRGAPRVAASQSFTEAEVDWLDQLFRTILRGGDVSIIARHDPELRAKLAQKVVAMKQSIARQKKRRAAWDAEHGEGG